MGIQCSFVMFHSVFIWQVAVFILLQNFQGIDGKNKMYLLSTKNKKENKKDKKHVIKENTKQHKDDYYWSNYESDWNYFGVNRLKSYSNTQKPKTTTQKTRRTSNTVKTTITTTAKLRTSTTPRMESFTTKTSSTTAHIIQKGLIKAQNSEPSCECGNSALTKEISGGEYAAEEQFPWVVRLVGGCAKGVCGGALVSSRIVLTAYHCANDVTGSSTNTCDHGDGKRIAILGTTTIYFRNIWKYNFMRVIDVRTPPNG